MSTRWAHPRAGMAAPRATRGTRPQLTRTQFAPLPEVHPRRENCGDRPCSARTVGGSPARGERPSCGPAESRRGRAHPRSDRNHEAGHEVVAVGWLTRLEANPTQEVEMSETKRAHPRTGKPRTHPHRTGAWLTRAGRKQARGGGSGKRGVGSTRARGSTRPRRVPSRFELTRAPRRDVVGARWSAAESPRRGVRAGTDLG